MKKETVEEFEKRGGEIKRLRRGEQSYNPAIKWSMRDHKAVEKKETDQVKTSEGKPNEQ